LIVAAQVHPGVQLRHLISVPIERQRRPLKELTDTAFAGLTPAWMVDTWIHVRVETVFLCRLLLPCVERLFVCEADIDDRFDTLEAVLPWHYKTEGCAVLVR